MSRFASFAASALLAVALAGAAFGAQGGFDLGRLTWTEIGLVLASGLLVAAAILRARRGRIDGGITALALAGLAVLCGVSILWSIAPELSWLETSLTITYLAVFCGAAALARLAPDGWAIVLRAVLIATAAIILYALATRVWPTLARDDIFARLGAPYSYWNALAATAVLAVPPTLWLGARRSGFAPANALAYPLLALIAVTVFLSYSRGAIIVAGVGMLLWVVFVPLRLRSLVLMAASFATAGPLIVWSLHQDAFTKNSLPLLARQDIAERFGLFVLATALVALGIGLVITFQASRRPPSAAGRLWMGVIAGALAFSVPVMLAIVLANSDRGLPGTFKAGFESLTSIHRHTGGGPERLLSASSSRGLYWHQAKQVFLSHYWRGTGAGTFGVARLRFRESNDQSVSQHAHGFVHQTMADLGTAGLVVAGVLLLAWLIAAGRAVGAVRRRRGPPPGWGPERVGLVALALAAVVYGMYSAVDWIWFVPGPTVAALVAAGFVVGRGPLPAAAAAAAPEAAAALGPPLVPPPPPPPPPPVRAPEPVAVPVGAGVPVAVGAAGAGAGAEPDEAVTAVLSPPRPQATTPPPGPPPPPPPPPPPAAGRRFGGGVPDRIGRPLLALAVVAAALIAAWAIWQPLRSDQQSDHALDLSANGKFAAALAATDKARSYDPLTPRPLLVRSTVLDASGHRAAAAKALEQAVREFPGQPQTWLQLAEYQLDALNSPRDALNTIGGALYLDPQSRAAQTVYFQANYRLNPALAVLPAPAPTLPPVTPVPSPHPPTTVKPSTKNGSGTHD